MKRTSSTERDVSPPQAKRKVTTTTTKSAVANFFKPVSEKSPEKLTFTIVHNSLIVGRYTDAVPRDHQRPVKIAAFDLDDTIIATKSGKIFARGPDDWRWWHATVPSKLKQLTEDGYAVVIISNQAGITLRSDLKTPKTGMLSYNNFRAKLQLVLNALDLPISLYAATEHDIYRKPRTGIWDQLLEDYGLTDSGDVEHERCIFVGDAAGREASQPTGRRKDHSCADRNFASNVKIPFSTPEEFFLNEAVQPYTPSFDPATFFTKSAEPTSATIGNPKFEKKHDVELVVFCGSPGAGKSTFFWKHLKPRGYERVNQDILKTRDKCVAVASGFLEEGVSVTVDNTNAEIKTRAVWIELAREMKVPVRLVLFSATVALAEHNNAVRALAGASMNPESRSILPPVAFTSFVKRFQKPILAEGFSDIIVVDFKFEGSIEEQAIWSRHWT